MARQSRKVKQSILKSSNSAHSYSRFIEKNAPQRYTLGVVYEPDVKDTDGDWMTAEDIEKACWQFMRYLQSTDQIKLARNIVEAVTNPKAGEVEIEIGELIEKRGLGDMHTEMLGDDCQVVECYIAPADFELAGERVRKGTWLLGAVWNEEQFQKIQSGERRGYSMGGYATSI